MTRPLRDTWIEACADAGIVPGECAQLQPAACHFIAAEHWLHAARVAARLGLRWCGFWAAEAGGGFDAFSCLAGDGGYLLLRTHIDAEDELASLGVVYPAADRPERHARDLLGIRFQDQPDPRRWTRHQAWSEREFPLQARFAAPARGQTPADDSYPFLGAHGSGVVEIPVGPVHAGIIEPGHFRFQAVGETVLNLEERLGYVHKGIERLAVGRDAAGLVRLAGRVSGDSTVAHAWAACQALERACGVEVPQRALLLRAIMAERERIANHMGDIGAICNDVGFSFAWYQLARLREEWLRANQAAFGHRLMMDRLLPGGVDAGLDADAARDMREHCRKLGREVSSLVRILEESESLEDRLMTTGRLPPEQAALLGAVGFVGKASGQAFDVRRSVPYPPYDRVQVEVPVYRAGDVAARARIRADEIGISLDLIGEFTALLAPGECRTEWPRAAAAASEGMGCVEGWRGEIITYLSLDADGRIVRFFPRDPSWLTWPALECLIQGNIVPDFPVCNKSVNASYSGEDL